jgi:GNAT superfamily N-acetyltransferase
MITCIRTNPENTDFRALVIKLDDELRIRDGNEHSFYAMYNKLDNIKHVIIAYENNIPIGCGAIKEFSPGIMEVKRMYVPEDKRGKGIASVVLNELEKWASESGSIKCILETGKKQPEAIRLYEKNGYIVIPNYGQYAGIENSICFEKSLFNKPERA